MSLTSESPMLTGCSWFESPYSDTATQDPLSCFVVAEWQLPLSQPPLPHHAGPFTAFSAQKYPLIMFTGLRSRLSANVPAQEKKTSVPTAATAAPGAKRTPTWATLVRERLHKRDHDNASPPNNHQARGQQSVRYSGDQRKILETPGQTERATDKNQPRFEPNEEVIVISSDNDEVDSDDEPLAAVRKRKTTSPNPSERPQKKRAPAQTPSGPSPSASETHVTEGASKTSDVVDANKTKKECELTRLKKEMRGLEQRYCVMAAHDASREPCITAVQNEAAQAKEDLAQANIAHEKQVTELQKRLEDTGADLRREQESNKELRAKNTQVERKNSQMKQDIEKVQDQYSQAKEEKGLMTAQNDQLRAQLKELDHYLKQQSAKQAEADHVAKRRTEELEEKVTWYERRLEIRNKEWHEREMEWRDYLLALDNNNMSLAERRRAGPIPPFNKWLGERRNQRQVTNSHLNDNLHSEMRL